MKLQMDEYYWASSNHLEKTRAVADRTLNINVKKNRAEETSARTFSMPTGPPQGHGGPELVPEPADTEQGITQGGATSLSKNR